MEFNKYLLILILDFEFLKFSNKGAEKRIKSWCSLLIELQETKKNSQCKKLMM